MKVIIKHVDGKTFGVDTSSSTTIEQLKRKIETLKGFVFEK